MSTRGPLAVNHAWLEALEPRTLLAATPLGPSFGVSTQGAENFAPRVAAADDGSFVVVWSRPLSDSESYDLVLRRFDAAGQALGPEAIVTSGRPALGPSEVDLAMDRDGDFVVVWTTLTGQDQDIVARRYHPDGTPATDVFRVHGDDGVNQGSPTVAMDDDGDFVVGWSQYETRTLSIRVNPPRTFYDTLEYDDYSYRSRKVRITDDPPAFQEDRAYQSGVVFVRRFDAAGAAQGAVQRVSDASSRSDELISAATPAVAVDADGDFVVGWVQETARSAKKLLADAYEYCEPYYDEYDRFKFNLCSGRDKEYSYAPALKSRDLVFKRFDAGGAAQGAQVTVKSTTKQTVAFSTPQVSLDADGDLVVGGDTQEYGPDVGSEPGPFRRSEIFARQYTAAGKAGKEIKVLTTGSDTRAGEAFIVADRDGNFIVTWNQYDTQSGENDVSLMRRYDRKGVVEGATIPVEPAPGAVDVVGDFDDSGNYVAAFVTPQTLTIRARQFEPPKPDLTAAFTITALPPAIVQTSPARINGSITLSNIGTGRITEQAIDIDIIASLDDVVGNSDDVRVTRLSDVPIRSLAVGGMQTVRTSFTLQGLPAGQFTLYAHANPTGKLAAEISTANNVSAPAGSVAVAPAFVDVQAVSLTTTLRELAVPGDAGRGVVRVANLSNIDINRPANITVYATASGQVDDSAVVLGRVLNQPLSLKAGANQFRDVTVPLTISEAVPLGQYVLVATVDLLAQPGQMDEQSFNNNFAIAQQGVEVDLQFGDLGDRTTPITLTQTDGTLVSFTIAGGGSAQVLRGNGFFDIIVSGAAPKSSLNVNSRKGLANAGSGLAVIRNVTISGPSQPSGAVTLAAAAAAPAPGSLNKFLAKTSRLIGQFTVAGGLKLLQVGDADGATIDIGSTGNAKDTLTLNLLQARNLSIRTDMPIAKLNVSRWLDDDQTPDTITAPWLGTLRTTGVKIGSLPGDFQADLNLAGTAPGGLNLGAATIAGSVSGASWNLAGGIKSLKTTALQNVTLRTAGPVGRVSVGGAISAVTWRSAGSIKGIAARSILDSTILLGVRDGVDNLPLLVNDFANPAAELDALAVSGEGISFARSVLAAGRFKSIALREVPVNDPDDFGFAALEFGSITRAGQKIPAPNQTLRDGSFVMQVVA